MGFKIEMPGGAEAETTYSMQIYGRPGVGKTTAALSAKNPILLNFEHGLRRVSPQFRKPRIKVDNCKEVTDFLASNSDYHKLEFFNLQSLLSFAFQNVSHDKARVAANGEISAPKIFAQ